jgi:hypothetical protein
LVSRYSAVSEPFLQFCTQIDLFICDQHRIPAARYLPVPVP